MNYLRKKLLSLIIVFSIAIPAYATNPYTENPRVLTPPIWNPDTSYFETTDTKTENNMPQENEMGATEVYDENNIKFSNYVDGYSIILPNNISADLSLSDVGTTFSGGTLKFRVFKESFASSNEVLSYVNYSNKFIDNSVNHTLEFKDSYSHNGRKYNLLQWSRNKLGRIRDDKNYYACVDAIVGKDVYTFYFTSSVPFSNYGGYMYIVDSLVTFTPTVSKELAYNKGYKGTDISRLNDKAKETYISLFGEDASFKMGMFAPDRFGGYKRMEEIEKQIGYKFCAFLVYTEFLDIEYSDYTEYMRRVNEYVSAVEGNLRYAQESGRAIELTLQTPLSRKYTSSNMIYEILNGDYDSFIYTYANMIAKYPDVTVLFRPFNEMNGDWCNYCAYHTSRDPQIYVELYKYLYKIFDEAGCDNTIWIWNPNERSFPNYKWNNEALYYPGDEYVDVYGITGYNTGTYYKGETWRSFDEIYSPIYKRALEINEKPMMITEFACSAIGGDKIKWIDDMFKVLPKYNKIKVGIWWHATDWDGDTLARPYFIDSPTGTLNVFDKYLN